MRKSIVAAATITAVLSIGTSTRNATAMWVVTPGQLGLADGVAESVEKTVLICGPWGCHWRPRYWGWYRPYPYPTPIGEGTALTRTPIGVGAAITGGAGIGTIGGVGAAGDRPIVGSHASAP